MKAKFQFILITLCVSTAAFGHAFLDHANPQVGSTLEACPPRVVVHFTQEIEPAFSTLRVLDAADKPVDKADAAVDPKDQTAFSVSIPKLPAGTYTVEWKVTSVDTHRTHGSFTFTVRSKE